MRSDAAVGAPVHARREQIAGQGPNRHVEPAARRTAVHADSGCRNAVTLYSDHTRVLGAARRGRHRQLDHRVDRCEQQVVPRCDTPDRAGACGCSVTSVQIAPLSASHGEVVEGRVGLVALRRARTRRRDAMTSSRNAARQSIGGRLRRRGPTSRVLQDLRGTRRGRMARRASPASASAGADRASARESRPRCRAEWRADRCAVNAILRHQPVADDRRPRSDFVAAVAEPRQHVAIDDAGVRRPDAAPRVDRSMRGYSSARSHPFHPRVPSAHDAGQPPVDADASRDGAKDAPADLPGCGRRRRCSVRECRVRWRRRRLRRSFVRVLERHQRVGEPRRPRAPPSGTRAAGRGSRAASPVPRSSRSTTVVLIVRCPATRIISS